MRNAFRPRLKVLFCLILTIGGFYAGSQAALRTEAQERATPRDGDVLAHGLTLFERECERCHGAQGLGDGTQANFLDPKPRDFSSGHFRLTSTTAGFPTDEDLLHAISLGMPGSTMPPFGHLPVDDQRALVAAVKHLAVEGAAAGFVEDSGVRGRPMTHAEALDLAREVSAPGPLVDLPPLTPATGTSLVRGRELFQELCVSCHRSSSGVQKRDMQDDTGAFIYPRALESSLFARGTEAVAIALTVTRGLPGTPMPAYELDSDDLWALVHYVQTLAGADEAQASRPSPSTTEPPARVITLTGVADPGVWTEEVVEVGYRGTAPVSAARIVLREGDDVLLVLQSADVTHTFYSPELGLGPAEVFPGHPAEIRFTAPAAGEYRYHCGNRCGHCHFSMWGTILVVDPAEVVDDDWQVASNEAAPHCPAGHDPPATASVVEQGEHLYLKMGCQECHGVAGGGGVANFNALPTREVPSLDRLVEDLMIGSPSQGDVETVLELLTHGTDLRSLQDDPPFPGYERFLRGYETVTRAVLEGRVSPPADPDLPLPPLEMPAWQARISTEQIDAVLAYLVTLYDWTEPEPVRQVVAFNHKLHIEEVGFDCVDCHVGVAEEAEAGYPSLETCSDCHGPDDLEAETVNPELVTLAAYIEDDINVPWTRVYGLADHVAFPHARHVETAGLGCSQCHGGIAELQSPPERTAYKLRMSWCLDCHRESGASEECRTCHGSLQTSNAR